MKINWKQANKLKESYKKNWCEIATLETIFGIFDLTRREDLTPIEELCEEHIHYANLSGTQCHLILPHMHADYEAFLRIWTYAKEKEELLKAFQRDFTKNYIVWFEKRWKREARGED